MKIVKEWKVNPVKCSKCTTPKSAMHQHRGASYCPACKAKFMAEEKEIAARERGYMTDGGWYAYGRKGF